MTIGTLKMELEDFMEMLRSDAELIDKTDSATAKIVRNYLFDIEEVYNRAFREE